MRLFGKVNGQISGDDRPTFFIDIFTKFSFVITWTKETVNSAIWSPLSAVVSSWTKEVPATSIWIPEVAPEIGVEPVANSYLTFDGSTGYVDTGQTFQSVFRQSFWVNVWVKVDDLLLSTMNFCGVADNSFISIFGLTVQDTGRIYAYISTNGSATLAFVLEDTPSFVANSEWKMITLVVNDNGEASTYLTLYVNGVLRKTGDAANVNLVDYTSDKSLYLGSENEAGDAIALFSGSLDDFRIYSGDPAGGAITAIYNSGKGTKYTGAVAEGGTASFALNMDEGTNSVLTDAVSGTLTALLHGGVTWGTDDPVVVNWSGDWTPETKPSSTWTTVADASATWSPETKPSTDWNLIG